MYIGTTQVQRPGDIIEGSHQHTVGMTLTECLSDTGNLIFCTFPCILQGIQLYGVLGDDGTITPYQFQRVQIRPHGDATFLAQIGYQLLHGIGRTAPAVNAHLSSGSTLFTQPFRNGRRTLDLQFHQLVLRAFQLVCCGNEITGICPEGSRSECNDSGTSRTVEARDKLTAFPMIGDIFALMRVGTGENTS